jgi:hypothetical protein
VFGTGASKPNPAQNPVGKMAWRESYRLEHVGFYDDMMSDASGGYCITGTGTQFFGENTLKKDL